LQKRRANWKFIIEGRGENQKDRESQKYGGDTIHFGLVQFQCPEKRTRFEQGFFDELEEGPEHRGKLFQGDYGLK